MNKKDAALGAALRKLFKSIDKNTDVKVYFSIPPGSKEPQVLVLVTPLFMKSGYDLDEVFDKVVRRLDGEVGC